MQMPAVEGYFYFLVVPVFGIIGPAVPDGDCTRTVFPFRDIPLKRPVLERVILDSDSQVFFSRYLGDALGHRPAFQYAISFQPKVKVQFMSMVLLYDKGVPA